MQVSPAKAYFDTKLQEYRFDIRRSPRRELAPQSAFNFLLTTYEAGAIPGKWDREALERPPQSAADAA